MSDTLSLQHKLILKFILKSSQISILGCGWLGLPLAKHLKKLGYAIKGSTTTLDKFDLLKFEGIQPYLIQLNEQNVVGDINAFLSQSETLILNIPPGLRKNPTKNHVKEIEALMVEVEKSNIKNILYVSSTSVFQDTLGFPEISDDTKPDGITNSAKQLLAIEDELKSNPKYNTTILRFAGLFDNNRHPGKILSGRTNIKNPNAPVNLIHKEDCISLISELLKSSIWGKTFNAAFPHHPKKSDYYIDYCKSTGIEAPEFDNGTPSKGKIINGTNVAQLLSYRYRISP